MVFHFVGLGTGISNYFALRIDDGGTSGRFLADRLDEHLRSDLPLAIYPVGEHGHFLPQSCFGFLAQRILP